jgi:hypothetical protein
MASRRTFIGILLIISAITLAFALVFPSVTKIVYDDIHIALDVKRSGESGEYSFPYAQWDQILRNINYDDVSVIRKNCKIDFRSAEKMVRLGFHRNLNGIEKKKLDDIFTCSDTVLFCKTTKSAFVRFNGSYDTRWIANVPAKEIYISIPKRKMGLIKSISLYYCGEKIVYPADKIMAGTDRTHDYKHWGTQLYFSSDRILNPYTWTIKKSENVDLAKIAEIYDTFRITIPEKRLMILDKTMAGNWKGLSVSVKIITHNTILLAIFLLIGYFLISSINDRRSDFPIDSASFRKKKDIFRKSIIYLAGIIVIGMISALISHFYIMAEYPYPFNTFLGPHIARFTDLINMCRISANLNPYRLEGSYLPFSYVIVYFFSIMKESHTVFILFIFAAIFSYRYSKAILGEYAREKTFLPYVIVLSWFTYPFIFALDRANIELIVFAFIALGIFWFYKGRYLPSAIFIACAAAMKIFPIVFIIIFAKEGKYKHVLISIVSFLLLSVVSLLMFDDSITTNIGRMFANQKEYSRWSIEGIGTTDIKYNIAVNNPDADKIGKEVKLTSHFPGIGISYMSYYGVTTQNKTYGGLGHGHSLFGVVRLIHILSGNDSDEAMKRSASIYLISVCTICFLILMYIMFIERERWRILTLLVVIIDLLPFVSADYKLIHMLIPILFFLKDNTSRVRPLYLWLFGLLLIPKSYYYFSNVYTDSNFSDVSVAVFINAVILAVLGLTVICDTVKSISISDARKRIKASISDMYGEIQYIVATIIVVAIFASYLLFM